MFVDIPGHFGVSAVCKEMCNFPWLHKVVQCKKMGELRILFILKMLVQTHSFPFDSIILLKNLARTSASLALAKNVNKEQKELYNLAVTHLHAFS